MSFVATICSTSLAQQATVVPDLAVMNLQTMPRPSEPNRALLEAVVPLGEDRQRRDNSLAETINELFEAEVIQHRGRWRSFRAVEYATLGWVD